MAQTETLPDIEILDADTYASDSEYGCTTIAQVGDRKVRVRIRRHASYTSDTHACLDVLTSDNTWEYTTGMDPAKLEEVLPRRAVGHNRHPREYAKMMLEGTVRSLLERAQAIFR